MNIHKKVEDSVLNTLKRPDSVVTYFEVENAKDVADQARKTLKTSIKAMRVYMRGKVTMEMHLKVDCANYRKAYANERIITERYIEQGRQNSLNKR